ncbi:MAG: hypothetical protein QOE70_1171 [Chthoniobacter sp.]|nr:hypothetical protein [Chthoniobacter sp.]
MNKHALVQEIIAALDRDLAAYAQSARAAHAEATHEQSKAENKYDTRGLEASYLAHGQSRQAAETEQARRQFESLALRDFGPSDPVDLGALIELERGGERCFYFLGPRAGGTQIMHENQEVLVLTPQSPLGQKLLGKKQRDRLAGDRPSTEFRIVRVW